MKSDRPHSLLLPITVVAAIPCRRLLPSSLSGELAAIDWLIVFFQRDRHQTEACLLAVFSNFRACRDSDRLIALS